MRTRRSLIAVAAAALGWWRLADRDPVGSAAQDAACVEPDDGPMTDGCPRPPRAVLRAAGGSQAAGLGTSCWAVGGSACCVDMIEPVYPACRLVVIAGEGIEIDLAALGIVSEMTLELRRDPDDAPDGTRRSSRRRPDDDAIWRLAFDRPIGPLRLPAFLPPGGYVIDLFAYAAGPNGDGDTAQGFRIVVESEAGMAATPTVGTTPMVGATPVGDPAAE